MEKMSEFCGDSLLRDLFKQLCGMVAVYSSEEGLDSYKELYDAYCLCNKLLSTDYYSKSDSIKEEFYKKVSEGDIDFAEGVRVLWVKEYNYERNKKEEDLKKLFKIIAENIEDWC